jgi:hypothetical protein
MLDWAGSTILSRTEEGRAVAALLQDEGALAAAARSNNVHTVSVEGLVAYPGTVRCHGLKPHDLRGMNQSSLKFCIALARIVPEVHFATIDFHPADTCGHEKSLNICPVTLLVPLSMAPLSACTVAPRCIWRICRSKTSPWC